MYDVRRMGRHYKTTLPFSAALSFWVSLELVTINKPKKIVPRNLRSTCRSQGSATKNLICINNIK